MLTGERNSTGGNGEGKENLCSLRSLLFKSGPGAVAELDFDKSVIGGVSIYAKRGDEADFTFLACRAESDEGWSPFTDNRPLLAAGKPELPALRSLGEGGRE